MYWAAEERDVDIWAGVSETQYHKEIRTWGRFWRLLYSQINGLHGLSGTYIETPAHSLGYENSYLVNDIPIEKLVDVPTAFLFVEKDLSDPTRKVKVTLDDLIKCPGSKGIKKEMPLSWVTGGTGTGWTTCTLIPVRRISRRRR